MRGGAASFVEDLKPLMQEKVVQTRSCDEWWAFFNPAKKTSQSFSFYKNKICQHSLRNLPFDPPPELVIFASYAAKCIADDIGDTLMGLAIKGQVESLLQARKEWGATIDGSHTPKNPRLRKSSQTGSPARVPVSRFALTYSSPPSPSS
jgi:hypothetical protein